jgi:hypothetical protein
VTAPTAPKTADSRDAPANNLWFGALFVVVGLAVIAGMVFSPHGLTVPMWVGLAAASTFVLAGLSVMAQSLGLARLGRSIAILVVVGLSVPGFWIMFGSGEMSCSRSVTFLGSESSSTAGDLECRIVFGAGAVLTLAVAVAFAVAGYRDWTRRPIRPTRAAGPTE